MNLVRFSLLMVGVLTISSSALFAQKSEVTLEDITINHTFAPRGIDEMVFLNDGLSYAAIADSGTSIVKYEIASGKKISKLLDLSKYKELNIKEIEGFEVSADDNTYLLYTNVVRGFRRSFVADYYTYNCSTHELLSLSDKKGISAAKLSPDGYLVAFAWKNNLYLKKLRFETESTITEDGAKDSIINGFADWVYEEEFGMTRAFEWNIASTELAFIRFDESKVKSYSFETSNNKSGSENFYPSIETVKYPKAGEANSVVSVHVFNVNNKTVKEMNLGSNKDIYVPRIVWSSTPDKLAVVRLNRLQNQFDLLLFNSASTSSSTIYTETSVSYVDADMAKSIEFLPDGKGFLITSEQDGFNHIYYYNITGIKQNQVTTGKYDVTSYYGFNPLKREIYYQSADDSPLRRSVWAASLDGKSKRKLSVEEGSNSVEFNPNFGYYLLKYSSVNTPTQYAIYNASAKKVRTLEENSELAASLQSFHILPKEFFTFKTSGGVLLNGWVVKPQNYNDGAKHPLVLMQYSGPNSQEVVDGWEIGWEQVLASQGFVVACVDGRGTGARGADFRKSTYLKLGKYETEDQVEAANYFGAQAYIDPARIAIWGWSFGGYMACNALTNGNGTFKVGIAVAPVTNWKFYDTVYAERFLRRPRDNERGYTQNSPYYQAQNLQGRLFIIHGTTDDNVHFQNLTEYANQLIANGKQFDMFVYPNRNHFINGGNTRLHLYEMMTQFLKRNL